MVSCSSWPVVTTLEQLCAFFLVLHHKTHTIRLKKDKEIKKEMNKEKERDNVINKSR